MSKSRLPSSGRKTRQPTLKSAEKKAPKNLSKTTVKTTAKLSSEGSTNDPLGQVHRFLGISLGGGKSDKACIAVLEYYPQHKKVFLSRIFEKIKSEENISADLKISEIIDLYRGEFENISFDSPLALPLCLTCQLKCPGTEACQEPHIRWMWNQHLANTKKKKPKKVFTPYTQRAAEVYLANQLEEPFQISHAMGANSAPLLARALFLKKRIKTECLEIFPKLSVWRIGRALGVMKSHLRFHRHVVSGDVSRRELLTALGARNFAFVYDQDVKLMIENNHAFESFICALTGFLKYQGKTEGKPSGFPSRESWIVYPSENCF